ncbi:hypothetical protein V440_15840 [Clostridioides difficile]|nr:hypothetical protein V440_15840 [Clostridioides difficile]
MNFKVVFIRSPTLKSINLKNYIILEKRGK